MLTINRRDFMQLHRQNSDHAGIVVCKQDHDWQGLAHNIEQATLEHEPLNGKLVRIKRASR